MRVYPDKFEAHLKKALAPVYLLYGEEPLQIMEASDKLRIHARTNGFDERTVLQPLDDSDWQQFRESVGSLSLFAERRIIEVRLPTGKPGKAGADALKSYCAEPADDVLLIINSGKLDKSGTSSAWFKAIDKAGVTMAANNVPVHQLGGWLKVRLAGHGIQANNEALSLIVERVEGNLLAAQQEVERLALLFPSGELTHENVLDAVADSARFSLGDLTQAALAGQSRRALRVLEGLRDEAVADVLVLWTLTGEVRAGARAAEAHEAGVGLDSALKSAGVWQNRMPALKKAISRHNAASWLTMLSTCSTIDRQVKGQAPGSVSDALESLVVQIAGRGQPLLPNNPAIPV